VHNHMKREEEGVVWKHSSH